MAKDYKKLNKFEDYDKEAAEELAEALNEVNELDVRIGNLRELVNENQELHPFVWRTAENKAIAIHKIEDDHFKNILQHIVNGSRTISKALRGEARKRDVALPTSYQSISRSGQNMIEAEIVDFDNIPF